MRRDKGCQDRLRQVLPPTLEERQLEQRHDALLWLAITGEDRAMPLPSAEEVIARRIASALDPDPDEERD